MASNPYDQASSTIYSFKYGRVSILNGDNYPQFKSTCSAALISANCLNIVKGTEIRPKGNSASNKEDARDFDERVRKATGILYNLVVPSIQKRIKPYMLQNKPNLMWNELEKFDHFVNPLFKVIKRREFESLLFNPKKKLVR